MPFLVAGTTRGMTVGTGPQKASYSLFLAVSVGYMGMFSKWKFIQLSPCDICTFQFHIICQYKV